MAPPGKLTTELRKKFEVTDETEKGVYREFKKETGKPKWLKEKEERDRRSSRTNSVGSSAFSSSRSGTAAGAKSEDGSRKGGGKGGFFGLLTKAVMVGAAAYGAAVLLDRFSEPEKVDAKSKKTRK